MRYMWFDDKAKADDSSAANQPLRPAPTGGSAPISVPSEIRDRDIEADPIHELVTLARSGYRLIYVDTSEMQRAAHLAQEVAAKLPAPLVHWTAATGMLAWNADERAVDEATFEPLTALAKIIETTNPMMAIFEGLSSFMDKEPRIAAMLARIARNANAIVLLIDPDIRVPDALRTTAAVYHLPRPTAAQIKGHIDNRIRHMLAGGTRNELGADGQAELCEALAGLTMEEIDHVIARLAASDHLLNADDLPTARDLRAHLLEQAGALTLTRPTYSMEWVAGLADFKQWAATRRPVLDQRAADFGLSAARGALLTGVPGCGKSFAMKALAKTWELPLLRLDAGALYASLIGESEKNLREAFAVAEALAPSILWIDEIEKGFASGGGSSQTDGGLGFRMVGMLLTWMQEHEKPVFLAATANEIDALPPELTRQGRFDEIFFVDLPNAREREHQFALQVARHKRDYRTFDCAALAAQSDGFSGAEIEQAVVSALYAAYNAGHDLDTATIAQQLKSTVPMSRSAPEHIAKIRAWGREHARAAA